MIKNWIFFFLVSSSWKLYFYCNVHLNENDQSQWMNNVLVDDDDDDREKNYIKRRSVCCVRWKKSVNRIEKKNSIVFFTYFVYKQNNNLKYPGKLWI